MKDSCTIAPWEDRIRTRFKLAADEVAALKAGRRKDAAVVLGLLWTSWSEFTFLATAFPELAQTFCLKTARELVGSYIDQI